MTKTKPDIARTNWVLVFMLLLAGLFAAAQFGKLTLTLDVMTASHARYATWAPILVSIVGVVGIIFGAVAGSVVTRIGIARSLSFALCLGGALSLWQALLPRLEVFAALRIAEGFSHLAIVVAAPTLIAACTTDRDRPLAMGIWACFFGLSFALTALFLPVLLGAGGLHIVFLAHGLGMLIVAALLYPLLPKRRISEPLPVSYLHEHKSIYTTARLMTPGVTFVWYTLMYIALLAVLPEALNLPLWSISAIPLVSLAGTFLAGFLARFVPPLQIAIVGFAATAGCMLGVVTQDNPLIAVFALMLVMGLIPGACFAAIPQLNESAAARARATGGIAQMGNVGTTLGTPIFVLAANWGGLPAIGLGVGLFCAIGIGLVALLRVQIGAGVK